MTQRKIPTFLCAFLVLLRIAIGWHFFVEGWDKVVSRHTWGENSPKRWTSKPFLQASQGPFSEMVLSQVGDPDEEVRARITLKDGNVSEALSNHWNEYLERYATYYEFTPDQKNQAKQKLEEAKNVAKLWLSKDVADRWMKLRGLEGEKIADQWFSLAKLKGKDFAEQWYKERQTNGSQAAKKWLEEKKVGKPISGDPSLIYEDSFDLVTTTKTETVTIAARVEEYQRTLKQIEAAKKQENRAFGAPVSRPLKTMQADARQMRSQLTSDLDSLLENRLSSIPTKDQKNNVRKKGPMPGPEPTTVVKVSDVVVPYGLLIVGGALIIGAFTRLSCILGAFFLLSVYLVIPALPWIEVPKAEGDYLFVNKNVIEMIALLTLATVPTGRWLGLDGLLRYLNPWRKREKSKDQAQAQQSQQ